MKLTTVSKILIIFCFFAVLPVNVAARYTGHATNYSQCTDFNSGVYDSKTVTARDQLDCRTDVACKNNQTEKNIPCQQLFTQSIFDPENFSIVSWVALAANIAFLGLLAYWVYLIFKGATMILSSFGEPDKLNKGRAQIVAALKSVAAMFVFLAILLIAGSFFGIGAIWQWPQSFSQCKNYGNKFYFTVRLENPGTDIVCN